MSDVLTQQAELILFFGVIAVLANWIAWSKGFYTLPPSKRSERNQPNISQVLAVFAIYLGCTLLLLPILAKIWNLFLPAGKSLTLPMLSYLQLFAILFSAFLLFVFCKFQSQSLMTNIWKDRSKEGSRSILYDFGFGVLVWLIAYPPVAAIGQLFDLLVYLLFGVENYEQVAVRYLKTTLGSPSLLISALFIILIAAPFIEELLFRGFLQNYFKSFLGPKAAILLASLGFALFHLSLSQGIGNISLTISLFFFSCFLGFVYERQGSLLASIGLHMTFNAVSSFRILFMPEI